MRFEHLKSKILGLVAFALTAMLMIPGSNRAMAQNIQPGFIIKNIASIILPTCWAYAPDGRIFVCEQRGRVRIVKNGVLLSSNFMHLSVDFSLERGLVGITFDPDFASNNYIYFFYTTPGPTFRNRISRFTANGDVVVPGSEVVLLEIGDLTSAIHNGGTLNFGPDGKLYIAVGDGGIGSNAQSLDNVKGKILRINKDGTIPEDNPFYSTTTGDNRAIWCYGLRNPYTFALQPGTGRMYINDVGANTWEEINEGIPGANYGWPETEGPTNDPRFVAPIFAYRHFNDIVTGCAIGGGDFYNPSTVMFPSEYLGQYFFHDYCNGWIRIIDPISHVVSPLITNLGMSMVNLKSAPDGSMYYVSRSTPGTPGLYRLSYATPVDLGLTVGLDSAPTNGIEIVVELRPVGAPFMPIVTRMATLNANGNVTIDQITPGMYNVAVKGNRWLQKVVSVDLSQGDVSGVQVELLGGDANNDNSVDVLDLDLLIQAFDSDPDSSNWNENADFDSSNSVDVLDLDILIRNFDTQGDP